MIKTLIWVAIGIPVGFVMIYFIVRAASDAINDSKLRARLRLLRSLRLPCEGRSDNEEAH